MLIMQLKRYAKLYAETAEGDWLNSFDWQKVPVITISELPRDVVGMYSFGKIVLLDTNVELIFSTYIHELRHRWQWKKSPLKYIVGKIYRPLIEDDADLETVKADEFILRYI
jgi:hypothetical protein